MPHSRHYFDGDIHNRFDTNMGVPDINSTFNMSLVKATTAGGQVTYSNTVTSAPAQQTRVPPHSLPAKVLLDLPDELLLEFAERLPAVEYLLNLRLACRRFSGIALDAQVKRMEVIYIDHSKASLERFKTIAQSPAHASGIKHIYYVTALTGMSSRKLAEDRSFEDVVYFNKVPEWLIEEVLDRYDALQTEQQAILTGNILEHVLTESLPLLPNLISVALMNKPIMTNVTYGSVAQMTRSIMTPMLSLSKGACMYNGDRCWKDWQSEDSFNSMRHSPLQEWVRQRLWYVAQFASQPVSFDTLTMMMRSLGSLRHQLTRGELDLSLFHGLPADAHWSKFASEDALTAKKATSVITTLRLDIVDRHDHSHDADRPPLELQAELEHWVQFVGAFDTLKNFHLRDNTWVSGPVHKAIFTTVTLPQLETFHYEAEGNWLVVEFEHYNASWAGYELPELSGFLIRHAKTLRHLHLNRVLGGCTERYIATAKDVCAFLQAVQTSLHHLETAEIKEDLTVAPSELPKHTAGMQQYPSFLESARAAERMSPIGRLAREFRAEVHELPLCVAHKRVGGEEIITELLDFTYEFGPSVLRRERH